MKITISLLFFGLEHICAKVVSGFNNDHDGFHNSDLASVLSGAMQLVTTALLHEKVTGLKSTAYTPEDSPEEGESQALQTAEVSV